MEIILLLISKGYGTVSAYEDEEIQMSLYEEIIEDIVLPRAKQKALSLLKVMDHTEAELRRKLSRNEYPSLLSTRSFTMLVNMDISMMNDMHRPILELRCSTSKRMIQMKLSEKGISKSYLIEFTKKNMKERKIQIKAIKKLIDKRTRASMRNDGGKAKIMAYLFRKGFPTEKIRQCLQ